MGMDRISGLMPQTGWSPLFSPATPKKAPASTVEPAAKSANTNGGMGAGTDTQTAQDHAQTARMIGGLATALHATTLPGTEPVGPPPDPNAPSGPMPTFDVSPLEEAAARVMAAPDMQSAAQMAQEAPAEARDTRAEPSAAQDAGQKDDTVSQGDVGAKSAADAPDTAPHTGVTHQIQERPWPQVPEDSTPYLDVTR